MGEPPLLVFTVSGVALAVSAHQVDEVSPAEPPTPIPGAPRHILGVVAVGERVLPVIDLVALLDLPAQPTSEALFPRTVLVKDGQLEAGLLCDRVRGLISVDGAAFRPSAVLGGRRLGTFLRAELDSPHGVVGMLDLSALLSAAAA